MRFNEFKNIELRIDEVSMKPGKLKHLAASIKAQCGIEFELYYPDIGSLESDSEPDYDNDETPTSIDHVVDFFDDGEYNDRHTLRSLRDSLSEMFYEYSESNIYNEWKEKEDELITEYIKENDFDEDDEYQIAYESLEYNDEQIKTCERIRNDDIMQHELQPGDFDRYVAARNIVDKALEDKVDFCIRREDRTYEEVRDEFIEDQQSFIDETDFFRDMGMPTMQDVMHKVNGVYLIWPHYINTSIANIDHVADSLSGALGREVYGCENYHGCESKKGQLYVIEPDTSLGDDGIEIVSPILSLPEMISDLHEVIRWAKENDCYTDEKCGLHMNVSLENVDMSSLDYVKLALFLGDEYVLKQFDRISNSYCNSAVQLIKNSLIANKDKGFEALVSLQQTLSSAAGKLIADSNTGKYTSINVRDNRIEFRSPGNDWLDEDINKLINTLNRFVVAMDIACDPAKHQQEYATKLYKLIYPSNIPKQTKDGKETEQITTLYSLYMSGSIHKEELKQQLYANVMKNKPMQNVTTQQMKQPEVTPQERLWIVTAQDGRTGTFPGDSAIAAINNMRSALKLNATRFPNNTFAVEPSHQLDLFNQFK